MPVKYPGKNFYGSAKIRNSDLLLEMGANNLGFFCKHGKVIHWGKLPDITDSGQNQLFKPGPKTKKATNKCLSLLCGWRDSNPQASQH
jgi:hypothetical protein